MHTHPLSNYYCHRLAWCLQSQWKILTKDSSLEPAWHYFRFKSNKKYKYIQQIALVKLQARKIRTQKGHSGHCTGRFSSSKVVNNFFHQGLKFQWSPSASTALTVTGQTSHSEKSLKSKNPTDLKQRKQTRSRSVVFTSLVKPCL